LRAAVGAALLLAACSQTPADRCAARPGTVAVTLAPKAGAKLVCAELADTVEEQRQGLMYRTDLPADGGMLFAPYPPDGPPREASFWMKDTPSALDIVFLRADGSVARIAADTVPFSEEPIPSGEPVAAVLELPAGRAAAIGLAEGDRVTWPKGNTPG
jgi:uncharacterized protein